MKKPIIGITCPWSVETWGNSIEDGGYYYAGKPYAEAISRFGGVPVLIAPETKGSSVKDNIDSLLEICDGLLFTGGGDVKRSNGAKLENLRNQQPVRYDFESELLKAFFDAKKPIIGICRGIQMIVEALGGTLKDGTIENHKQNLAAWEPWHNINLTPGSKLEGILGVEKIETNSFHVQQTGELPKGFIVAARADDGVIESIEYTGDQFVMGFQFHPEEMVRKDERFGAIFKAFLQSV